MTIQDLKPKLDTGAVKNGNKIMNIYEILNENNEPLNEGFRFGSKEMQLLAGRIDEFLLGVEYELHVKPELLPSSVSDTAEISYVKNTMALRDAPSLEQFLESKSLIQSLSLSISAIELGDDERIQVSEDLAELISVINRLTTKRPDLYAHIKESLPYFNEVSNLIERTNFKKLVNAPRISMDSIIKFVGDNEIVELFDNASEEMPSTVDDIIDTMIAAGGEYIDDIASDMSPAADPELVIPFVTSKANEVLDMSKVENIELDPSYDKTNGHVAAEIITKPLSYNDTMIFMHSMFEFIREFGRTSDFTGLHVNLSHRNFSTGGNFDPLKMVILLSPDYLQSDARWRERNDTVASLYVQLGNEEIALLADVYNRGGIPLVEQSLKDLLIRSEKFRSINFTALLGGAPNERRVEFRLFGGANMEDRMEELARDIPYTMYAMLAGTDHNFLRREYLEQLVRLLNKLSERYFKMSFVDLAKLAKEE